MKGDPHGFLAAARKPPQLSKIVEVAEHADRVISAVHDPHFVARRCDRDAARPPTRRDPPRHDGQAVDHGDVVRPGIRREHATSIATDRNVGRALSPGPPQHHDFTGPRIDLHHAVLGFARHPEPGPALSDRDCAELPVVPRLEDRMDAPCFEVDDGHPTPQRRRARTSIRRQRGASPPQRLGLPGVARHVCEAAVRTQGHTAGVGAGGEAGHHAVAERVHQQHPRGRRARRHQRDEPGATLRGLPGAESAARRRGWRVRDRERKS